MHKYMFKVTRNEKCKQFFFRNAEYIFYYHVQASLFVQIIRKQHTAVIKSLMHLHCGLDIKRTEIEH